MSPVSCLARGRGVFPCAPRNSIDEFLRLGVHWYCHYNGSAANYSLVGYALAEALKK